MTKDLNELLPLVQVKCEEFLLVCKTQEIDVLVTGTYRSFEEQDTLYAKGRTAPGPKVTNARGGESEHNWRIAFDCVPLVNGVTVYDDYQLWAKMEQIALDIGLERGGAWASFPDLPHFAYTLGYTWQDFLAGNVDLSKFNLPTMNKENSVKREIINKTTLDKYPVLSTTFNEFDPYNPTVEFTTDIGVIIFTNKDNLGNLLNEDYEVKEIHE